MMTMIIFRPATAADSDDLLRWRNDEQTRLASVSQDPVTADEHEGWFTRSLVAEDRWIYIAILENTGESVGMCRLDLVDGDDVIEISINLNPDWRGKGVATSVLTGAIERFRADRNEQPPLVATVRRSNVASARIFSRAGFVEVLTDNDFAHYRLG